MKLFRKIIGFILLIIIIIISVYIGIGYKMYKNALQKMPIQEKISNIRQEKNYTTFEELPKTYIDAVIAVEDHRFYKHKGVDIVAVCRAIFNDIKNKELREGGSSITQQLCKNIYFNQNRKLSRKIAETFMAIKMEKECSKKEIFELYVNTSYFGDGYYCIGDASQGYFNKKPIDMNIYECTLLAGVPNAPSIYAPTNNLELAEQRQKQVINKMVEYGYLTIEEADNIK